MTPRFLVVDDDVALAHAVARQLRASFPCTVAHSIREARDALRAEEAYCGFILDLRLPDGDGLDLLKLARKRHPNAPAVLLTGSIEVPVINETYDLGASFVAKPLGARALVRFLEEANACAHGFDLRTQRRIADAVLRFDLSSGERDLLVSKVAAIPREVFVAERQITMNTYKTKVRTLIRKMNVESLEDARRLVTGGELLKPTPDSKDK